MFGKALSLDVGERDVATAVSEAIAVNNGARILRTHNVANALQVKQLTRYYSNQELIQNV